MHMRRWLIPSHVRLRPPSRTIRLRLTILYASLFLASGIGLLSVTYVLVRHATGNVLVGTKAGGGTFAIRTAGAADPGKSSGVAMQTRTFQGQVGGSMKSVKPLTPQQLQLQLRRDRALAERQHTAELHQLLEQSGIALAIMAALSIGIGWFAAGRVLRPLRTINERAREISVRSLHKRLSLVGPDDELTQLASTFDDLLGRLEGSFAAQRQFVANASHELRTPLARARTIAEVALADPDATVDTLRASHLRVLAAGEQQERLIEALLTLARSERGLDVREPVDLASLSADLLEHRVDDASLHGVTMQANLHPAATIGNAPLAERLIVNLFDNALRYNVPGGQIDVTTRTSSAGQAVLSVANSGPLVPPGEVERLSKPFQRLGADRTDRSDGVGLGLSIVAAIAIAHDATVTTRARATGGLEVEVAFPGVAGPDEGSSSSVAGRAPASTGRLRGLLTLPRSRPAQPAAGSSSRPG
jgi:signal transduction histidine kinase